MCEAHAISSLEPWNTGFHERTVYDIAHIMADDSQLAEATQALSFAEFLERMKDPQAANLVRSIKKCVFHRFRLHGSARAYSSSITCRAHRER